MGGTKIYDVRIILALGLALLLGAGAIMLLYTMPVIRYCLLAVLLGLGVWKRKFVMDLLKKMKNK